MFNHYIKKIIPQLKWFKIILYFTLIICFFYRSSFANVDKDEVEEVSSVEQANYFLIGYLLSFVVGKASIGNNLPANQYIENNLQLLDTLKELLQDVQLNAETILITDILKDNLRKNNFKEFFDNANKLSQELINFESRRKTITSLNDAFGRNICSVELSTVFLKNYLANIKSKTQRKKFLKKLKKASKQNFIVPLNHLIEFYDKQIYKIIKAPKDILPYLGVFYYYRDKSFEKLTKKDFTSINKSARTIANIYVEFIQTPEKYETFLGY